MREIDKVVKHYNRGEYSEATDLGSRVKGKIKRMSSPIKPVKANRNIPAKYMASLYFLSKNFSMIISHSRNDEDLF